jgi:nitroimidazol reductase NimA-like FMN-containing flavoprotein (pyridoxamine 5'-phosphate oxidase superfamily)
MSVEPENRVPLSPACPERVCWGCNRYCQADPDVWQRHVVIFGRYEEILDTREHEAVRHRALELFERRSKWWLPGAGRLTSREHHAVVVYRIQIQTMTGRRAARDPG